MGLTFSEFATKVISPLRNNIATEQQHSKKTDYVQQHPNSHQQLKLGNKHDFASLLDFARGAERIKQIIFQYNEARKDKYGVYFGNSEITQMWYSAYRSCFTEYISCSLPLNSTVQLVASWFLTLQHRTNNPNMRLIDLGTGSGIWPFLLLDANIPHRCLVAVDLPIECRNKYYFRKGFWPDVVEDEHYVFNHDLENDVVFIAWGSLNDEIMSELERSAHYVIILGEEQGGQTYPAGDFFENNDEWVTVKHFVPGGAREHDILSFNTRIVNKNAHSV